MFPYFGDGSCFPRIRLKSQSKSVKEGRQLGLREKRKRIISEPIPIEKNSAAVDKLLGFQDNNNLFSLTDASSFSESPCHRGFNRLYISETSSTVTEYHNGDDLSTDGAVFVTPREDQARRNSVCVFIPPKPPRMRQKRTFICQHRGCGKAEILLGRVQVALKSCTFCFTHYCSARCQNEDLAEHLKVCFYGKIDTNLDKLIRMINEGNVNRYLSKLAFDKYIAKGRGCLFIVLPSNEQLQETVDNDSAGLRFQPLFSSRSDVERCCVSNRYRRKLLRAVETYEPATQFIVNIAIVAGQRIPNNPVPRKRDVTVRKIVALDLHEEVRPTQQELLTINAFSPIKRNNNEGSIERRRKSI